MFSASKKISKINQNPQLQKNSRFGHFAPVSAARGFDKKRLWTGASLRQTATEPLEATEKFRASSKNFGSRRRAFSGTMRHWPRWPKGPQMTAFLPRQDSPPGLCSSCSRAWLACWGLCRRLVQRSVRSQPIPTS
ncbi:hypothetical protein J3F84DRAFT_332180 [Trichoderma pleuroticola]